MRIVLDTNVVLSALLWRGTPYHLLQAIRGDERARLFTSGVLLTELARVLARPALAGRLVAIGSSPREIVRAYADAAELVAPVSTPRIVSDPDDDHVLAAALGADADLVISGDRHLLSIGSYNSIRILSPADALGFLAAC